MKNAVFKCVCLLYLKITEAYGTSLLRSANVCEIESEGIAF